MEEEKKSRRPHRFAHLSLLLFSVFNAFTATLAFHYANALSKSLLYFESQRSGRLYYDQRVTWRDHSALTDCLEQGVDLVGGCYDASDHVKFGLPMGFTVTMLSWSVIEYNPTLQDRRQQSRVGSCGENRSGHGCSLHCVQEKKPALLSLAFTPRPTVV